MCNECNLPTLPGLPTYNLPTYLPTVPRQMDSRHPGGAWPIQYSARHQSGVLLMISVLG